MLSPQVLTKGELDATAALTRLCGRRPYVLTLHAGACFVADSRSFGRLPDRQGNRRQVALRCAGADISRSSQGRGFRAEFRLIGGGHHACATADSEVLAVARAAVA